MDIRNGRFTGEDGLLNKDFFDLLREYEDRFDKAKANTKLPEHPDYDAIRQFQYDINMETCITIKNEIKEIMDDPKYSMRGALDAISKIIKEN